jgi:hypothetical protein
VVLHHARPIPGDLPIRHLVQDFLKGLVVVLPQGLQDGQRGGGPGGERGPQEGANDRAVKNAQEIDTFLSGANPNIPKGAILSLLGSHWAHHVAQNEAANESQLDPGAAGLGRDAQADLPDRRRPGRGDRQAVPGQVRLM